jgi:regulator of cell morphogenesis and NO signaling
MLSSSQFIRDIAADHPSAVALFERFEIDISTLADKSLSEACSELHLSLDQVLEKLEECREREVGSAPSDPSALSCVHLIQHIVRVHHRRVRQDLPSLVRQARDLKDKSGEQAPALKTLARLVEQLQQQMLEHIRKEEEVLFPFIVQMEEDSILAYPPAHACFRSVSHPVFMMVQEHESANLITAEIRGCTEDFTLPELMGPAQRALVDGLCGFEEDLQEHIRLENNFLFPRTIQMEAEIHNRK